MPPLRISLEDAHRLWRSGRTIMFIDTRNPKAWATAEEKIPGAVRIPLEEIEAHLNELDRHATIITYCT